MKITVAHARSMGYCSQGMLRFAKHYNLDFREFLRNGIDEEILLATKDSLALKLVTAVKSKDSEG